MIFPKSKINWEDSYFGGSLTVLNNHPTLTGWHISVKTVDHTKTSYLYYYEKEKLAKILIYRLNKLYKNDLDFFKRIFELAVEKPDAYYLKLEAVQYMYAMYMNLSDDLMSFFLKFKDDLFNLQITIKKDEKKKSSPFEEFVEAFNDIKELERFKSLVGSRNFETKYRTIASDSRRIVYESHEVLASNQLISNLDVNFAVGSIRHDNLITGKLAEHKIAEGISGNTQIYYRESEKINTKPFHVCILMDQSGSMEGSRYKKSYELLRVLYRTFSSVLPPEKLSIYGHSGNKDPKINIYQEDGLNSFNETYDLFLHAKLEENYDGPVTEQLHKRIRAKTKEAVLMIVVSDGCPAGYDYGGFRDYQDFKKIIERAKRDDFIIAGIGVESSHVEDLYKYYTIIHDFDKIVPQVSRLVNFIVKTEFQS